MSADSRIAAAVALGVEHVKVMRIPPSLAQECARRYLLDEARDYERAQARAIEQAASDAAAGAVHLERERIQRKALAWAAEQGGFYNDYDRRKFKDSARAHDDEAHWARVYGIVQSERATLVEFDESAASSQWGELSNLIRDGVDAIIDERAAGAGMAWTAALLTTTVAMPDGERVPWGEATVEQHRARLDMLATHAASELETASRHRAAIEAIESSLGATCLNDLATVRA